MAGLIGTKIGMTSIFGEGGAIIPCTVIQAGPCVVTQVKSKDKDGYDAVQLGYGDKKEKNTTKPLKKHFEKSGAAPKARFRWCGWTNSRSAQPSACTGFPGCLLYSIPSNERYENGRPYGWRSGERKKHQNRESTG